MVVVALTAAFAAVIIGYDAGFIGGTVSLQSFQDEFKMGQMSASERTNVSANVVSVFQAGAFWGAIFFYPIGEILGRKIGLFLSGFFLTFGAAISLYARSSTGLGAIYAGRVLTGIGIGGCSGLAPIYISESSPALIRGKLVGMWEMSWQVGGVVGYWINYGVLQNLPNSRKQWLIPFAIQLVPSGMFWAGTMLIPESPRFLVNRGNVEKARKNLSFLRKLPQDHPYSIHEMDNIVKDIEDKRAKLGGSGFFAPIIKVFTSKKTLYRLLLSTSLFPMQNGSGINAITYYSPTVFKSFGITGSNAGLQSTGVFGLLKAFASLVWLFFVVDRFGRKTALVWGSFPCSLCMWYIGAYIKIANPAKRVAEGNTQQDAGGRAAQAMLYIWTIFYGASWNGTPWVINSEIFSQEIRTVTQAINAAANWFWAFVMGRWSGQALDAIGYKFYFIFGTCMIVFPCIILLLYPETKEVPLEAIDHLFEGPAWRAREHALKMYRIEYEGGNTARQVSDVDSEFSEKHQITHSSDHNSNSNLSGT
ncbi:high-affinity hexose transporter [Scheffersomyces xylosifermentans]|uniref:high-affinity hexose transporter n=1 Tax=Scheffersomyces xylosifermentans TaxID=1304137 RepID=UPI00315CB5A0